MIDELRPFTVSNDLLDDPERLGARLSGDGYLFFRALAPEDALLALRRDVLEVCAAAGWLDPVAELMEGVWSGAGPFTEGDREFLDVYRDVIHLERFEALPELPVFMDLARRVLGHEPLLHRRKIGRITFPQNVNQTIMAHQDFHYIRGTPRTYTLWLPLGDCPTELGSLAVLRGSHRAGFLEHRRFPEKNVAFGLPEETLPREEGIAWHGGDFALGDVLLFHAYTVHEALPNLTENRLRLSIDNRYQHPDEALEPGAMGTHYDL